MSDITYAKTTTVSPERTASEIESLVSKYGAKKYAYMKDTNHVIIGFVMNNRQVRFCLTLPSESEYKTKSAYEQATRSKWRSLLLCIKSKLESVSSGIETFEESFLAQLVLPNNKTFAEWAIPQVQASYEANTMPPLLPTGQ